MIAATEEFFFSLFFLHAWDVKMAYILPLRSMVCGACLQERIMTRLGNQLDRSFPFSTLAVLRFCLAVLMLSGVAPAAVAGPRLLIEPQTITLEGPLSRQQLIVTAQDDAGDMRDVTALSNFSATPTNVVDVQTPGLLLPRGNGKAF